VQANGAYNGAYKRALLTGIGWTLAAVAALVFFKSTEFEPIYLWTLGVVALGWAGVLLQALAVGQRAASAALAAAGGETRTVIDGLARAMGLEMQRACMELLRVDELLAHASAQLMTAFNSVSDETRRHQGELERAAAGAQGTPEAERLRAAVERVANDVNGAVTALQFRDVVGQKLGHVRRELETLEQVMHRIRAVSGAQADPAVALVRGRVPGQVDLVAQVRGLLQQLEQGKAASPVRQELMHAGEIELF